MAIDIATETLLTLADAAKVLPRGRRGRPAHLSCVLRWVLTGAKAIDGRRIRLDAVRLGGRWITSREALQRFAERLTPRLDTEPAPAPRTADKRQRASEAAKRELERLGI